MAKRVIGCGSNVVDRFFRVRALPKPGEKGFFLSPTKILETSVVGGVTLNHLAWASQLSVPTSLLALQGDDSAGSIIREAMKKLGVGTELLQVSDKYVTAESYVFLQPDGERSIIMASGATSMIDAAAMTKFFVPHVPAARMVTTEVSQVPLGGVQALLSSAKQSAVLSVLDVDVAPSVAVQQAKLGSYEQLLSLVRTADVLKPAKHAAVELLSVLDPNLGSRLQNISTEETAQLLLKLTGCKLVAITNGGEGCSLVSASGSSAHVPAVKLAKVIDATGAGDAFLGGLIAGLSHRGLPNSADDLRVLGALANATGAACCSVLGALPDATSKATFASLLPASFPADLRATLALNGSAATASAPPASAPPAHDPISASIANDIAALSKIGSRAKIAKAVDLIAAAALGGRVFTSGMGKSYFVAARMAASLSSIGHPSQAIHAAEWVHGDIGAVRPSDVVIVFSNSGETQECVTAAAFCAARGATTIAVVGRAGSKLAGMSTLALDYDGKAVTEPIGLVPTSTVVVQEAIVNAIVSALVHAHPAPRDLFARNHPGGSIGKILNAANVDDSIKRVLASLS
eukprot:m.201808 g.201808  ORF g.201808 m.201808 type:complete len:576 (-) comp10105_c0_seq19:113-1840(-)